MRTTMAVAILVTCGVLGLIGAKREMPEREPPKSADHKPFVVHEWGTFTNFSASDGTQLAFRSVLGEELPAFVRHDPLMLFTKGEIVARHRMETPVTYFYSDRPRTVEARVDFPLGRLTEFYPPTSDSAEWGILGGPTPKSSSLAWQIMVRPEADFDTLPELPDVEGDERYGYARETDSAIVEVAEGEAQKHYEKFLFYRGAGDFSLPLRLEAHSGSRFRVVNDGREAIAALFMVTIDDDGLSFREYSTLGGHDMLDMQVPDVTATADELGERMAASLVAAGLYDKEARAMIATWQSSWFREPGARLFYLVPRRLTDEIIPLHVEPAPDEMVRVLVGRMEILTPEGERHLRELANTSDSDLLIGKPAAASELNRLGRFARPAVDYLLAQTSDPVVQEAFKRLRSLARR